MGDRRADLRAIACAGAPEIVQRSATLTGCPQTADSLELADRDFLASERASATGGRTDRAAAAGSSVGRPSPSQPPWSTRSPRTKQSFGIRQGLYGHAREEHYRWDLAVSLKHNSGLPNLVNQTFQTLGLLNCSKRIAPLEPRPTRPRRTFPPQGDGEEGAYSCGARPHEAEGPLEAGEVTTVTRPSAVKTSGKCRRLHLLVDCWTIPGVHHWDSEVWGTSWPKEPTSRQCALSACRWAVRPQKTPCLWRTISGRDALLFERGVGRAI